MLNDYIRWTNLCSFSLHQFNWASLLCRRWPCLFTIRPCRCDYTIQQTNAMHKTQWKSNRTLFVCVVFPTTNYFYSAQLYIDDFMIQARNVDPVVLHLFLCSCFHSTQLNLWMDYLPITIDSRRALSLQKEKVVRLSFLYGDLFFRLFVCLQGLIVWCWFRSFVWSCRTQWYCIYGSEIDIYMEQRLSLAVTLRKTV